MPISAAEEAMSDFILANSRNFSIATLTYNAFPRAAEKLISKFALQIEHRLSEEPGWKVTRNTFALMPRDIYSELKWAPAEWEGYGWGISLSAQRSNVRGVIFGLYAVSNTTKDPDYLQQPEKYPPMPDTDRMRLGDAITPLLGAFGRHNRATSWWPRCVNLTEIDDWMHPPTLTKIACATGESEERDFVSDRLMDEYIVDMFRAVKSVIDQVPDFRNIRPVSG